MEKTKLVEASFLKMSLPDFNVGDTVKVLVKIPEGDKFRIHPFEGTVIERRGQGTGSTFTVRKVSYGEGVERTFLTHSPMLESIELVKRGKVRRARLFYLRERVGKATKIQERQEEKKAQEPSTPVV